MHNVKDIEPQRHYREGGEKLKISKSVYIVYEQPQLVVLFTLNCVIFYTLHFSLFFSITDNSIQLV